MVTVPIAGDAERHTLGEPASEAVTVADDDVPALERAGADRSGSGVGVDVGEGAGRADAAADGAVERAQAFSGDRGLIRSL